jgi:hypothetical protein
MKHTYFAFFSGMIIGGFFMIGLSLSGGGARPETANVLRSNNYKTAAESAGISTERDPNPPLPTVLTEIPPVIKTETAPPIQ